MCKVMCTVHLFFLSVPFSPFALHRAMKLKLPRYSMEHTVVHTPGNYLTYSISIIPACYKVNRKLACFTSSRCCHVRAREETEPNRERSDSRRRGEKTRREKEKKGASFTHEFNIPPPPSPLPLPAPLPALPRGVHCYSVCTT